MFNKMIWLVIFIMDLYSFIYLINKIDNYNIRIMLITAMCVQIMENCFTYVYLLYHFGNAWRMPNML